MTEEQAAVSLLRWSSLKKKKSWKALCEKQSKVAVNKHVLCILTDGRVNTEWLLSVKYFDLITYNNL